MGVWIETRTRKKSQRYYDVTPYVGVWIETYLFWYLVLSVNVTPYVGVWIETYVASYVNSLSSSHPTWVCGLKP